MTYHLGLNLCSTVEAKGSATKEEDKCQQQQQQQEDPGHHVLADIWRLSLAPQAQPDLVPGAHAVGGPAPFRRPRGTVTSELCASVREANTLEGYLVSSSFHNDDSNYRQPTLEVMEEAEAMPLPLRKRNSANNSNRKGLILVLLVTVLIAATGTLLVVFLGGAPNKTTEPIQPAGTKTTTTTPAPQPIQYYPPFHEDLSASIVNILQDPTSPEYQANIWMLNDPHLESYSKDRQWLRFALSSIYYATQGDQWHNNTHWLSYNVHECKWFTQATEQPICNANSTLVTLDLQANNLNGTLPNNFWDVKTPYMDVSHNLIQGQLTAMPADMDFLEYIDISHNQFEGPFVGAPGFHMNNVLRINVSDNCFSGNSGVAFRVMPKLQFFRMANNCIAREMTTNFQYTNIRELSYRNCRLFGSMPTEFGLLTHLRTMDYSGNSRLMGTLPSELNQLTNLVELNLTGTQFTGPFPEGFCQHQAEGRLQIHANCSLMECC